MAGVKKVYDLAVKTGEYEQDGETKGRYKNVGVVLEGKDGMFVMLDKTFNPAGVPDLNDDKRDTILISMFEPRDDSDRDDKRSNSSKSNSRGNSRGR
jgi:hypothetical protein